MKNATNTHKTNNKTQQTASIANRVALIAAVVGASPDEIDAAILGLRRENRQRLVTRIVKARCAARLAKQAGAK